MNLCKYKDKFGKPNEGVHSYRIFNLAIVDFSLTALLALFLSKYFVISFLYSFGGLMIIALGFHIAFCVPTTLTKLVMD